MIFVKEFKFIPFKSKKKQSLFSDTETIADLERSGLARTELFSNRSALIEGCLGVEDYKDDYIKIRVKKGYMIFCGSRLDISCFENKTIKIGGVILRIEFCLQ